MNSKRPMPRHIIIKLKSQKPKTNRKSRNQLKKSNLQTKELSYDYQRVSQQKPYRPEEMGDNIFKALKEKNHQSRTIHPTKLSFKMKEKERFFPDKEKLREFITNSLAL